MKMITLVTMVHEKENVECIEYFSRNKAEVLHKLTAKKQFVKGYCHLNICEMNKFEGFHAMQCNHFQNVLSPLLILLLFF